MRRAFNNKKAEMADAVDCALRCLLPNTRLHHSVLGCPWSTDNPSIHEFKVEGAYGEDAHALVLLFDSKDFDSKKQYAEAIRAYKHTILAEKKNADNKDKTQ